MRLYRNVSTLGLALLGPVLARLTFAVMGPFSTAQPGGSALRLVLLADLLYLIVLTGLVVARMVRIFAARRNADAGSRLHTRLVGVLNVARMGTRIYASGTETMIGLTVQLAQELGMDPATVITEHRGSRARRVQCVHCKGMTENVTTNIVTCAHCGLSLLVRDHYSKRRAAFQGVCVDAEVRGEIPEITEIFK